MPKLWSIPFLQAVKLPLNTGPHRKCPPGRPSYNNISREFGGSYLLSFAD